jgi:hypothetical protein
MRRKLICAAEAKPSKVQHRTPCSDCPFRRDAIPGWLGGKTPMEFVMQAHGEVIYPCHAKIGPQCAGMAIYRANVCKVPRDGRALSLPPNTRTVFAGIREFVAYHSRGLGAARNPKKTVAIPSRIA